MTDDRYHAVLYPDGRTELNAKCDLCLEEFSCDMEKLNNEIFPSNPNNAFLEMARKSSPAGWVVESDSIYCPHHANGTGHA